MLSASLSLMLLEQQFLDNVLLISLHGYRDIRDSTFDNLSQCHFQQQGEGYFKSQMTRKDNTRLGLEGGNYLDFDSHNILSCECGLFFGNFFTHTGCQNRFGLQIQESCIRMSSVWCSRAMFIWADEFYRVLDMALFYTGFTISCESKGNFPYLICRCFICQEIIALLYCLPPLESRS